MLTHIFSITLTRYCIVNKTFFSCTINNNQFPLLIIIGFKVGMGTLGNLCCFSERFVLLLLTNLHPKLEICNYSEWKLTVIASSVKNPWATGQ